MMLDGIALSFVYVKCFRAHGCYETSHALQVTRRPEMSGAEEGSLDEEIETEGSHI